jgi:hypothetical protein
VGKEVETLKSKYEKDHWQKVRADEYVFTYGEEYHYFDLIGNTLQHELAEGGKICKGSMQIDTTNKATGI